MLTKDKLKKTIDALPDHFTIEDVIEELIVIDKIEQGMRDVEEGNVLTNEQVREKLGKWLK
jgi:predicted transcriptional regulator